MDLEIRDGIIDLFLKQGIDLVISPVPTFLDLRSENLDFNALISFRERKDIRIIHLSHAFQRDIGVLLTDQKINETLHLPLIVENAESLKTIIPHGSMSSPYGISGLLELVGDSIVRKPNDGVFQLHPDGYFFRFDLFAQSPEDLHFVVILHQSNAIR